MLHHHPVDTTLMLVTGVSATAIAATAVYYLDKARAFAGRFEFNRDQHSIGVEYKPCRWLHIAVNLPSSTRSPLCLVYAERRCRKGHVAGEIKHVWRLG
jgi:hypothetical protein